KNNFSNKHFLFSKNLLETYFKNGYVNLSSNDDLISHSEPEKPVKTMEFEVTIEGLTEKLKHKIEIIENLKTVNIIKWIKEFEVLATMNEWDEKIKFSVANVLIQDSLIDKSDCKNKWCEFKKKILSEVYPKIEERYYKRKLNNVFQSHFFSIKEYYDEIKKNVEILDVMANNSKNESGKIFEEAFYNGLGKFTFGKLIELEFGDYNDCYKYLLNLESKIIVRNKEMTAGKKPFDNKHDKNINNKFINEKDSKYFNKNKEEQKRKKYCKLHKWCFHSTEDCTTYDKDFYLKNERNNQNKNENFLIKEIISNPDRTSIEGRFQNEKIELRFDCGATKSFIKESWVQYLQLEIIESKNITTIFGNGTTEKTNKTVFIEFYAGDCVNSFKEVFYVLKDLPENLLLGGEFMFNNEVLLDYKNKVIIIQETVIPMIINKNLAQDEIEKILYDKLLVIDKKYNIEGTELEIILKEYINKYKNFKHMKINPVK
ncbi:hypothetical protein DMUE_4541, partial [Dictyocoela muelleri]